MLLLAGMQSESDLRAEEMAARMDLLREQTAALEAKLGGSGGLGPPRSHTQVRAP